MLGPACSTLMAKKEIPVVLIVEDEFVTRMVAADAMTDIGLQVLEAGDADEALHEIKEHPNVSILFTDVQMPGKMSGLDLAEKIHESWPHVELIVTSASEEIEDADLPDHGTFIRKPYNTSQLVDAVAKKLKDQSDVGHPH